MIAITATSHVKRLPKLMATGYRPVGGNYSALETCSAPQPRLAQGSRRSSFLVSFLVAAKHTDAALVCVCVGVEAGIATHISHERNCWLVLQLLHFFTGHEWAKATVPDFRTSQSDPHEQSFLNDGLGAPVNPATRLTDNEVASATMKDRRVIRIMMCIVHLTRLTQRARRVTTSATHSRRCADQ